MNRGILGGLVALAIAVLTGISYFMATSSLEGRIETELRERVKKSVELLVQNANLDMLKLQKRVELTARDKTFARALDPSLNPSAAADTADEAFQRLSAKFKAEDEDGKAPDIFAIVDTSGKLIAQMGIAKPVANQWLEGGKPKYPSIALALDDTRRQVTSEIWEYQGRGLLKVGIAPVIDADFDQIRGALVMGYSQTATEAQRQESLLGADIAYFHGDRVFATSFRKGGNEDTTKQADITRAMKDAKLDADALEHVLAEKVHTVELDGSTYLVSAGRLPRFSSKKLPDDYPPYRAGAVVLASLSRATSAVAPVRTAIGLLGVGAIIIAMLGMAMVARSFLAPLDYIEVGINEIINGNLERTFQPPGRDFEGMANALNVMMARLLGRPEPGEEEYDEHGNVIVPSALKFDTDGLSPKEAEAVALSQEPEADYYKRIYDEYVAARSAHGDPAEGVSFDSFVSKLHLNESTLKRKYDCRAVRFKVVVKEGKVILKPVPIA